MTETKANTIKVRVTGKGITIDRAVSDDQAQAIIAIVMGGAAVAPSAATRPAGSQLQPQGDAGQSPKLFLVQKKPSTDVERVACLGYFLAHYRNTQRFKTKDITKLNTEAAQRPFSNSAKAVNNASGRNGYLAPAGAGHKQISPLGEAVVDALPNREAVNAAIAEHSVKRRAKRRRKAQKS